MWSRFHYHFDAINDWTNRDTKCTTGTIIGHFRNVGNWIKLYCLVSGVIASHVTLSTIDTHILQEGKFYDFFR